MHIRANGGYTDDMETTTTKETTIMETILQIETCECCDRRAELSWNDDFGGGLCGACDQVYSVDNDGDTIAEMTDASTRAASAEAELARREWNRRSKKAAMKSGEVEWARIECPNPHLFTLSKLELEAMVANG